MKLISTRLRKGLLLFSICLSVSFLGAAEKPFLPQVNRVLVLGDSITYGGLYVDYLEAYLLTRYPERHVEFINVGLPSETVSGLSEAGHAGGKFPRPDLHERLERILPKAKPDLVVACYGMNDGIYFPFSEERLHAYQEGVKWLRKEVAGAHASMIHLTPPVFDPVPVKANTLPAGLDAYPKPYVGYNDVLDRYSEWLLSERKHGWNVVDLHSVMNKHLAGRRKESPDFIFARDGVHDNATGHWLFAQQLLLTWGAPAEVDSAVINAKKSKVEHGQVTGLIADKNEIHFDWKTRRPMPMDPQWDAKSVALEQIAARFNRHTLTVKGLTAKSYQLFEGEQLIGTATGEELAKGVDLLQLPALSTNKGGAEILKLIRQQQKIQTDAWLTDTGHKRPGMAKGLPLEEARIKTADLEAKLRELTAPVTLKLRLVPQS